MRDRNGVVDVGLPWIHLFSSRLTAGGWLSGGALFFSLAVCSNLGAQTPARFYTVTPCRAVDTRSGSPPFGAPSLAAGASRSLPLAGACGTPPTAMAIAANVTLVAPSVAGTLTIFPAGISVPNTSTINYRAGAVRANNAVLTTGVGGAVGVLCRQISGTADLIIDVVGYFDSPLNNQPPRVSAGAGQSITLPASASLSGTASDDGLPAGSSLVFSWTKVSGPGTVTFTTPASLATSASFSQAGTYLLALSASDTQLTATSSVSVTVLPVGGVPALFIASLLPQGSSVSSGSGSSTLLLAGDERSAVVRYGFSNLTTPFTSAHIHGPADPGVNGPILFDLDSAPRQSDGSYVWTFVPVGTTTVAQILTALKTGRLYINVHTSRYPSGEIRGQYGASNGSIVFVPPPPPPALPPGPPTASDAARFLTQATYGPTLSRIAALQGSSFSAWLSQQMAQPADSHLAYLDAAATAGEQISDNTSMEAIWKQALTGNDALRARVALALSEILVISDDSGTLGNEPYGLSGYMDLLNRDAFGNYRQLLEDVTLSPAMGVYLNMQGNDKEDPASGRNPNENYAREILQLFSIGLYRLHPDGRLVLGTDGQPQPTYNQESVAGFAHVFTGWSFAGNPLDDNGWYNGTPNFRLPMQSWPEHHSTSTKKLLNGLLVPGGQTAAQDLAIALDDIFTHPNVGPFLGRQLIQRLVTSNPSPAYVYRVASVFNDNGAGVRGDLGAVVRAILLDYEARSVDVLTQQGYGKQREPMIRYANLLRAFGVHTTSGKFRIWNLEDPIYQMGQNPLRAPTVFNFFEPGYLPPGSLAAAGLFGPEFKITTETQAIGSTNTMRDVATTSNGTGIDDLNLDYGSFAAIAGNPATLIDQLDLLLTSKGMSSAMKAILVDALNAIPESPGEDRVRAAVSLIVTSPEFVIQR